MMNFIEEFLQIEVHHPLISFFQILLGLGNCRMATSSRSKAVALRMERWLIDWFEDQSNCFLNHPVDDIWNAKTPLPS